MWPGRSGNSIGMGGRRILLHAGIGIAFGAYSKRSASVGLLIGQVAELGGASTARGRHKVSHGARGVRSGSGARALARCLGGAVGLTSWGRLSCLGPLYCRWVRS